MLKSVQEPGKENAQNKQQAGKEEKLLPQPIPALEKPVCIQADDDGSGRGGETGTGNGPALLDGQLHR